MKVLGSIGTAIAVALTAILMTLFMAPKAASADEEPQERLPLALTSVERLTAKQFIYLVGAKTQRDADILWQIAKCESGGKQFNADGSVVQGRVDPDDRGLFQVNRRYWLKKCSELGHDIETERGNINCALYIFYEAQGIAAWNPSKSCWSYAIR